MHNIWAKLPYKSYAVSGHDTTSFLQGQLTQDVNQISENHCQYGAFCSHKGRMFGVFLLNKLNDTFYLRIIESSEQPVVNRLKMFVLRAKVTFEALSDTHIGCDKAMAAAFCEAQGITLPTADFEAITQDGLSICALPKHFYEIRLSADSPLAHWFDQTHPDQENTPAVNALRLAGGHFNIQPDGIEKWLPQQTPLENWGSINYQKGCYVGQEIIARNKYLGQVKKGFAVATIDAPLTLAVNAAIQHEGRDIGQIIETQIIGAETICLGLMPFDRMQTTLTIEGQPAVFHRIQDDV